VLVCISERVNDILRERFMEFSIQGCHRLMVSVLRVLDFMVEETGKG